MIKKLIKSLFVKSISYSMLEEQLMVGEFFGISELAVCGSYEHFKRVLAFIKRRKLNVVVSLSTDTEEFRQDKKYLLTSSDYKEKISILQNSRISPKNYLILPFFDVENTL